MKKSIYAVVVVFIFYLIIHLTSCSERGDVIAAPSDDFNDSTKISDSTQTPLDTAKTFVNGIISASTIWKVKDSPFNVVGNVLIDTGVTLTIEPGVVVRFNSGKFLRVDGELIARGKQDSMIVFTSNSGKVPGFWKNIVFTSRSVSAQYDHNRKYAGGSVLQYVRIEYAGGEDVSSTVNLTNAGPLIDNCTVQNCSAAGIYARFENSQLSANSRFQILQDTLIITNCTIQNNSLTNQQSVKSGGIYSIGGNVYYEGNTVINNIQPSSSFGYSAGGICALEGKVTLTNNTVKNNFSSGTYQSILDAGGICVVSSIVTMKDNIVTQNSGTDVIVHSALANLNTNQLGHLNCYTWYQDSVTIVGNSIVSGSISSVNNGATRIVGNTISQSPGTAVTLDCKGGSLVFQNNNLLNNHSSSGPSNLRIKAAHGMVIVTDNSFIGDELAHDNVVAIQYEHYEYFESLIFKHNTVTNHNVSELFYFTKGGATLDSNNVYNNNCYYLVYNDSAEDINVTNNWWGTTSENEILSRIYDYYDDFEKGKVHVIPFATQLFP